ncbi:hypothetical protein ARMSODRAFT_983370 [Armillaria solidipes]|uniref:Uncharacterized protein n=1 Tax=Armillaria solidipes TaxID=1076256 RepID=A0A2H3B7K8_9AGAR|nr:hypothetical protein ARMSODRAFT_983370 [Armillaria solidipes]
MYSKNRATDREKIRKPILDVYPRGFRTAVPLHRVGRTGREGCRGSSEMTATRPDPVMSGCTLDERLTDENFVISKESYEVGGTGTREAQENPQLLATHVARTAFRLICHLLTAEATTLFNLSPCASQSVTLIKDDAMAHTALDLLKAGYTCQDVYKNQHALFLDSAAIETAPWTISIFISQAPYFLQNLAALDRTKIIVDVVIRHLCERSGPSG